MRYIVGIAKNKRLGRQVAELTMSLEELCGLTGKKQRLFRSILYDAFSWDLTRLVIVKVEHSFHGANPRFVVTNLSQTDQYLYDTVYCTRGDMANRMKDQQLDLFACRISCHSWRPD